jgi:hypothetical protein
MALYGELSLEDDIIKEILSSEIPRNPTETKISQWLLTEMCPMLVSYTASEHSREELIGGNPET